MEDYTKKVSKVLALQGDSLIERFSLKCKIGIDSDPVNGWICNVLRRGVSHLELFLDFSRYDSDSEDMYFLPEELFVSKTLVELKLRSEYGVDWWYASEGTFLPMLKTLDIDSEWIILYDELEMFCPAFPVLEELYLANMTWSDCDETALSASLKQLTIYASVFVDFLNPKCISFDTPSESKVYSDFVAADYPKVNLTNLVEARLKLMVTEDQVKLIRAPNNEDGGFLRLRNAWNS